MKFKEGDRVVMTKEHDDFFTTVPGTVRTVGYTLCIVDFDKEVYDDFIYEGEYPGDVDCPLHGPAFRTWNIYPECLKLFHPNPQMELFGGTS